MNELIMNNYLLLLKSTVEVYVHGTLEASNEEVRMTLKGHLDETMSSQADTYDEMTKYGWYIVENINKKEINKILNKVTSSN